MMDFVRDQNNFVRACQTSDHLPSSRKAWTVAQLAELSLYLQKHDLLCNEYTCNNLENMSTHYNL